MGIHRNGWGFFSLRLKKFVLEGCKTYYSSVPLICLTETQLSSTIIIRDVSSTFKIVRNNDQFDKFKRFAVLYKKYHFKCLEQEHFDSVIYIKFSITLCNLSNFSMLLVYKYIANYKLHSKF